MFCEVAEVGSGVVMVSVSSSGVAAIQADWVPLPAGLLVKACVLSILFCRRPGDFDEDWDIICTGKVLERWGKVCSGIVDVDSGGMDWLDGAGRFKLTWGFELWRFFNISGRVLNRH